MDNIIVYDMIDINSYISTLDPATFNGIIGVDINKFNFEFVKLLAGIYKLANDNVTTLSDEMKKIKKIPTLKTMPEDIEEINIEDILMTVRMSLGNLILIYDNLYEIFVKFYNVIMSITTDIDNKDSDVYKEIYEQINSNRMAITKEDQDKFTQRIQKRYNFTPLIYQPINIDLAEFNLEGLEAIGSLLLDKIQFVKQNINELLEITNEFTKVHEEFMEKINSELEKIAQDTTKKFTKSDQSGGVKVAEVKDKLLELKSILDSFNINSMSIKDVTIPTGINLSIQSLGDLLKIFKTKAELNLGESNVEFNMMEDIPQYLAVPKGDFIKSTGASGNFTPKIPDVPTNITNIDDIIESLNDNNRKNLEKLDSIKSTLLDIDVFDRKTTDYINIESNREYPFSLSNIGSIEDLKKRDEEIDKEIAKLRQDIEKLKLEEGLLLDENFKSYVKVKKELEKHVKENPTILEEIRSVPLKLKLSILYFFKEFDILKNELYIESDNFQKNNLDKLYMTLINSDKLESIKLNTEKLKILNDIAIKINSIENFGYDAGFFLNPKFYMSYNKMYKYMKDLHKIISTEIKSNMKIAGQNKNRAIEIFLDKFDDIKKKVKDTKDIYKHLITEFIWTINQNITISLIRMDELIEKLNSDTKIKKYNELLEQIDKIENSNPNLNLNETYLHYNIDQLPTDNIDTILQKISDESKKLDDSIKNLLAEQVIIKQAIQTYGRTINFDTIFKINDAMVKNRITKFKRMLSDINNKLRTIYDIKYQKPNYKPILEGTKLDEISRLDNINWLQQFGGHNPSGNIRNINKFEELNVKLKEFMKTLEQIRLLSTELLIIYERFLENITNTIIYLIYKIVVITLVKNKMFVIPTKKFDRNSLQTLQSKLLLNKKQNLNIIKKIYSHIINNIIDKLNINGKIYVDLNPENKSIFTLFILYHLDLYI